MKILMGHYVTCLQIWLLRMSTVEMGVAETNSYLTRYLIRSNLNQMSVT
jgi:hypothetical protein